ncbi:toprim domain-containing protein [Arenibacter certesii]|uniref:Transposase n=1 Tax=Arenibacter certesii TaxID=228955 RepID=A0A918ISG8_9FLAO|nr:toprim domain-containing protein [Arenibacter certesii]GGW28725.1 transposase [Arenibacter certesii]
MQRTNKISCERARDYPIGKALAKLGHFPTKESEKEAWFLSPFRSETQASFKVSKKLNRWYDHGEGKGGNVIDLICLLNGTSVKETLAWLQKDQISFSFQQQPLVAHRNENDIHIRYARPITHFALISYLHGRKISVSTAIQLCQEVHYIFRGREYFAIGLRNNSGGWELRNKYYKNSNSPKDITHIINGKNRLIVTEGMFDMLSLMERERNLLEENDILILNSLGFIDKTFNTFTTYKSVALYLDNDRAGKKVVNRMMEQNSKCEDRSNLYEDFKDVNAWWTDQNQ